MPETPSDPRRTRSASERSIDHASIERLTTELLPSLIAKLGATGLGELEVREGAWRVRLRRPASGRPTTASAPSRDRAGRAADRADRADRVDRADRADRAPDQSVADDNRSMATSPAVGVYRPPADLSPGDRVHRGDALGAVDMLGVPQEVVSPADGVVGASLVEAGDAVEYGQPLLVIERTGPTAAHGIESSTNGSGAS